MEFLASKFPGLSCQKARCINAIQCAFWRFNRGSFTQKLLQELLRSGTGITTCLASNECYTWSWFSCVKMVWIFLIIHEPIQYLRIFFYSTLSGIFPLFILTSCLMDNVIKMKRENLFKNRRNQIKP